AGMHVGETLRAARERRGMSLRELAADTGLTPGYLSKIEVGDREPSLATLRRIAAVWDLQPLLHLVSTQEVRQEKAGVLNGLDPDERLYRQNPAVADAAVALIAAVPQAVLVGAVA